MGEEAEHRRAERRSRLDLVDAEEDRQAREAQGGDAFLGTPTFCLDNKNEKGWDRLAKFSMFFDTIYYTDAHAKKETQAQAEKDLAVALAAFVKRHGALCWKGD